MKVEGVRAEQQNTPERVRRVHSLRSEPLMPRPVIHDR